MLQVIREFAAEKLRPGSDARRSRATPAPTTCWRWPRRRGPSFARPISGHGSTACARSRRTCGPRCAGRSTVGTPTIGLRTAGAIWDYWHYWAELREGVRWLEALLALPAAGRAESRCAQRRCGRSPACSYWQGEADRSFALYEEALAIVRTLGDDRLIAATLYRQRLGSPRSWRPGACHALAEESRDLYRRAGDETAPRSWGRGSASRRWSRATAATSPPRSPGSRRRSTPTADWAERTRWPTGSRRCRCCYRARRGLSQSPSTAARESLQALVRARDPRAAAARPQDPRGGRARQGSAGTGGPARCGRRTLQRRDRRRGAGHHRPARRPGRGGPAAPRSGRACPGRRRGPEHEPRRTDRLRPRLRRRGIVQRMATDKEQALKRLGGGRWQTRDERFTIEPQGGTWVVVDAEQTDDLGLALVRGPYGSLRDAKEAIEQARRGGARRLPAQGAGRGAAQPTKLGQGADVEDGRQGGRDRQGGQDRQGRQARGARGAALADGSRTR